MPSCTKALVALLLAATAQAQSNGVSKAPGFVIRPPWAEGTSIVINPGNSYYFVDTLNPTKHQNYPSGPQDYYALDFVNAAPGVPPATFDVFPIAPGIVEYQGLADNTYGGDCSATPPRKGYGYIVFVRHLAGYSSLYAHLDPTSIKVGIGQAVDTSSMLARAGTSGLCAASGDTSELHLHLSLYQDTDTSQVTINQNGAYYPAGGTAVIPEPFGQCTLRHKSSPNNQQQLINGLACSNLDTGNRTSATSVRLFKERSAPAAIVDGNGQLHVLVKGTDDRLFFRAQDCSRNWSSQYPWTEILPPSQDLRWTHTPALALDSDGNINTFVRGSNGKLYHAVYSAPPPAPVRAWSSWHELPELSDGAANPVIGSLGAPAAVLDDHVASTAANPYPANLQVFTAGPHHALYVFTMNAHATHQAVTTNPWVVPGGALLNNPVPLQTGSSPTRVYVQGTTFFLYKILQDTTGAWGSYSSIYTQPTVGEIAAYSMYSNLPIPPDDHVFARDANDLLVNLSPGLGGNPVVYPSLPLTHNPALAFLGGSPVIMTRNTGTSAATSITTDGAPLYANTGATGWQSTWNTPAIEPFHSDLGLARTGTGDVAFFGWESGWLAPNNTEAVPFSKRVYYAPLTSRNAGPRVDLGEPVMAGAGTTQLSCQAAAPTPSLDTPTVTPAATATPQRVAGTQVPATLGVDLQWSFRGGSNAEPVGTRVFRDRTSRSDPAPVLDLLGTVLSRQPRTFRHSGVLQETEYCYRLQSYLSPTNASDYSRKQCVQTLAAPTGFSLRFEGGTSVRLTWQDNSLYETNYHVQRRPRNGTTWEEVARLQKDKQMYLTDPAAVTGFCYRVYGSNRDGESLPSSEVCAGGRVLLVTGTGKPTDTAVVAAGIRQWLPNYSFTQIAGEPTATDLAGVGILAMILPSTSNQLATVRSFASNGGGVLIVGDHGQYTPIYAPAVPVYAAAFGITLAGSGILPTCNTANVVTVADPVLGLPTGSPVLVAATDVLNGGTRVLVTSDGQSVFNVSTYGQGRVAVSGDANIWGAGCPYDNSAFSQGLFSWLSGEGGAAAAAPTSSVRATATPPPTSASTAMLRGRVARLEDAGRFRLSEGARQVQVVLDPAATVCRALTIGMDCTGDWRQLTAGMVLQVEGSLSSDGSTLAARSIVVW